MLKILLVEDDPDQAFLARVALEEELDDVEVIECHTGEEALSQAIESFGLIILDYNLPDMTGLDILEELSGREHGPIVMVTGEEVLEIAIQSLKEGADEFVLKSVDIHAILPHVVERTISNFHWRKNMEEIEHREREKKVQIDTLKRIMMTLAHHLNNGIMPIIFSAELCKKAEYSKERTENLVKMCLRETQRINFIIERFERYIEEEEFKYMDYLDLKDAMFDMELPENEKA
jgi:CheY-like chemotaxis protein